MQEGCPLCHAWAPGPALTRGQGRERGPQAEPPPLSSLRLLEGCLCCSFCRLFREAVLSLGTSDFMSICKGTHLCLLPAKGQGLGVTQVQRASASFPTAPSCHTVPTHGGEKASGPFGLILSSDIPPSLTGWRKSPNRTLGHGGTWHKTPLLLHCICPSAPFCSLRLKPD